MPGMAKGKETMTLEQEDRILNSMGVRKTVHEMLAITGGRDPVDVLNDAELVVEILKARLARMQG